MCGEMTGVFNLCKLYSRQEYLYRSTRAGYRPRSSTDPETLREMDISGPKGLTGNNMAPSGRPLANPTAALLLSNVPKGTRRSGAPCIRARQRSPNGHVISGQTLGRWGGNNSRNMADGKGQLVE